MLCVFFVLVHSTKKSMLFPNIWILKTRICTYLRDSDKLIMCQRGHKKPAEYQYFPSIFPYIFFLNMRKYHILGIMGRNHFWSIISFCKPVLSKNIVKLTYWKVVETLARLVSKNIPAFTDCYEQDTWCLLTVTFWKMVHFLNRDKHFECHIMLLI